jgi:dolichyl-phosphate beta-glucosyltransferase
MQVRQPTGGGASPAFSLVFPVYNPGQAVEQTWHQVQAFRQWAEPNWEFLFVCDGCTDGTPELLKSLTAGEGANVRVLSYEMNQGKGYAVRLGLREARGRWRLFTDVDLAYSLDDVMRVAKTLEQGAEVAIASRVHPDSRVLASPQLLGYLYRRSLQSWVFSTLVQWILPLKAGDTQAGLKGLSGRVADLILPRLECSGFEFDCELLTACARLGVDVAEVPVTVRYENTTTTTATSDMVAMLRKLWTIRRNWRTVSPAQLQQLPDAIERHAA